MTVAIIESKYTDNLTDDYDIFFNGKRTFDACEYVHIIGAHNKDEAIEAASKAVCFKYDIESIDECFESYEVK